MTDIFDVLSDVTRRQILELLSGDEFAGAEASVSEIVAATGLPQPTVSKQLKVLRDARLVVVREDGQHRLYRLSPTPLRSVDLWLAAFRPRDAQLPEFVRSAARGVGRAAAELLGKAPWR